LKRFNTLLSFLVFIFFIPSCATQKSKEAPSKVGKFYHDVTSKFNGYFNANELLEASMVNLNEQHQDNYNKILSIYKYSAADNATVVAGDLDNAIKKVSIVASLHPASHWKDDCYLLMGQAQYVKKDYESAEETLEFMVDEYDPKNAGKNRKKKKSKKQRKKETKEKKKKREQIKKEKKKAQQQKRKEKENARDKRIKASKKKARQNKRNRRKGKRTTSKEKTEEKETEVKTPESASEVEKEEKEVKKKKDEAENYFLKHKPAFQEGVLWLARTYIERDKFDQAARLIDRLKNDPNTFKEVKRDLAPAEADFYLKQKKYAQAIIPLERAIDLSKSKGDKARYAYIVGQLHQRLGQGESAYAYFEKAKKYSRDYEMRFSSQLNMETNAWLNGKATPKETIAQLNKMLKDDKNEEYQDQIHYALASVYLKTNQTKEAIVNLQLSLNKSETNPAQKAESYLLLAQLFFQDENYVSSKNYYDSTLLVMAKTDDRYPDAQKYANSLTEIAANIQTIELQDSLLRISTLSDDEKRKVAAKLRKEEEALIAQNKAASQPSNKISGARPNLRPNQRRGNQFQEASTWVFYDDKKVKKGKRSFERKWGNRKLEDDWRRSNRRGASQADEEVVENEEEEGSDLTDEEVAKILSDVPSTPEEVAEVKGKIKDALYILGTLYRDRLENNEKAVETLGQLEKRFPRNDQELNAWYYQYLSYTDLMKQPTAKTYKDKIIGKYPESTYAKVLNGETLAFEDEEEKLKNYYKDTYSDFTNLEYQRAYDKVVRAKELFGEKNILQPKFALLSSMCIGNLRGKGDYVKALKEVVARYPETPEQTRAKEILRLLGELKEDPAIPKEGNAGGRFKLQDRKVHYMIVVLKGGKIELGDAKIKVSNYNREYHKTEKLRISNIYLGADTNTPILVIRRFKNKDKAVTYFQGILANKKKFLGANNDYEVFAVTQHNYREILKSKSVDGYREFFNKNYK
jgi:tetratricopeptide (TPR) repeat protein